MTMYNFIPKNHISLNKKTKYKIKLEEREFKKLRIELFYFLEHMSCFKSPYVWDQDPIADDNLRDSESFLREFLDRLNDKPNE